MIEHIITIFRHMGQYKPFFGRYPLNICIGTAALTFLVLTPVIATEWYGRCIPGWLRKIFFGLGLFSLYLFWSLALPLYQTPDEQSHFAYVYHLAEFGTLPVAKTGEKNGGRPIIPAEYDQSLEFHEIIFDVNLKHTFSDGCIGTDEEMYSLPRLTRQTFHSATADEWWKIQSNHYPPLYYALGTGAYSMFRDCTFFTRFWAVRLLSILLSLIAVLLTFYITHYVFPDAHDISLRYVITALFALFPMYCQVSISVNPNILEIVIYEAYILAVLWASQRKLSIMPVLSLTAIVSAGMLTKQQFIGLLPVTTLFILIKSHRAGIETSRQIWFLTIFLAGSVCLAGWWYVWFYTAHGRFDFFTLMAPLPVEAAAALRPVPLHDIIASFAENLSSFTLSFWGGFSWQNLHIPHPVAYVLSSLMMVALFGAGIRAFASERRRKEIILLGALVAGYVLLLNLAFLMMSIQQRITLGIAEEWYFMPIKALLLMLGHGFQGRYYYPILSGLIILMLYGLSAQIPYRLRPHVYSVLIIAMALFNFYSIFFLILPRFY